MFKKLLILIFTILLFVNPVQADMFGASDSVMIMKLTAIYNTLKDYYLNGIELLNQAKAQSNNLKKISQLTKDIEGEYDFVKNFSLERELANIKGDLGDLSNLDNLDGKSTEEQLKLIRRDVDRRFRYSNTKEERDKYANLKSRTEEIERLQKLKDAKAEESKELASKEKTEKEYLASISSSTALISGLQLAEEQRRAEEDLGKDINDNDSDNLNGQFKDALKHLK